MNREIEFRGKHANKWIYGYLLKSIDDNKFYISVSTDQFYQVKEETIGQYTGLKDKNGKKIFEGDILYAKYNYYGKRNGGFYKTVEFNQSQARFNINIKCCNNYEIIGNIYEKEGK